MKKNIFVDLHVLQTVPPSCVNRDDTGSPKTAIYGGTLRSRVSSQAWKRAMRLMFKDEFEADKIGFRTRNISLLLKEELKKKNEEWSEESLEEISNKILELGDIKSSGKKDVLFFISSLQIKELATIAEEYSTEIKEKSKAKELEKKYKRIIEEALIKKPSVDILLFGRMAANNVNLNYDAAVQVSHAISTHTISNEYDYFTACDDVSVDGKTGAGHLGTVEFNSSTMYRYANINVGELAYKDRLDKDDIVEIVGGFINAFVKSMPTGKQNTFANRTLPYFVYATVRTDQPINFVSAFEKPVKRSENGFEEKSEIALIDEINGIYENYSAKPEKAFVLGKADTYEIGEKVKYNDLVEKITNAVEKLLGKED